MWKIKYHRQVKKELPLLKAAHLDSNAKAIIEKLKENPFYYPPPVDKLRGDMLGMYSRRINQQHRIVYTVENEEETVKILSMWSHYHEIE